MDVPEKHPGSGSSASYHLLETREGEAEQVTWTRSIRRPLPLHWYFGTFNLLVLAINVGFFVLFTVWPLVKASSVAGSYFAPPSPVQHLIEPDLYTFKLESVFYGTPNPELDDAWETLVVGDMSEFGISEELFRSINPSPETGVKVPNDPEGSYLATFDKVHQLHCINLLRKSFYKDHYPQYIAFEGEPEERIQAHREHCIEQLRQAVMCHSEVSIMTYNWVKGERLPKPNFKTMHSCQNWDRLKDWSAAHSVSDTLNYLTRPKGHELEHVICEEGVDCPTSDY